MMRIRFWGVRGSIATCGADMAEVGGNTACVEVRCQDPATGRDGEHVVLDAGTGLRALGASLLARAALVDATILVSHFHWDHIQGFPFFTPAYAAGNRVALYGRVEGSDVRTALAGQMRAPHFPVGLDAMRAALSFHDLAPRSDFSVGAVRVRTVPLRHPNGCLAYRLDYQGRSVVYATDTEHDEAAAAPDAQLVALARGADVLIYDAQYTADEYVGTGGAGSKRGWGHSTPDEGVRLACAAGVGHLVLFHHDPSHDDAAVAEIEAAARARFPTTSAAREGFEIALRPAEQKAA